jgi:hypothetical protein
MAERFNLERLRSQQQRLENFCSRDWSGFPEKDVAAMAGKINRISGFINQVNQRLVEDVGPRMKRVTGTLAQFNTRIG